MSASKRSPRHQRTLRFQNLERRRLLAVGASFSSSSVREDETVSLIVNRVDSDNSRPLVIRVAGGDSNQLALPSTIRLAAGQDQTIVRVAPVDDSVAERTLTLNYTFTAPGHRSATATLDLIDNETPKFQNPTDRFDVNNDGQTSALDALHIINALNDRGDADLDPTQTPGSSFLDVNGDYRVTAIDALSVINALNRNRAASTEPANEQEAAIDAVHRSGGDDEMWTPIDPASANEESLF